MQAPNYEINKGMILVEEAQHVSYVLHKRDNNNQKYQDKSKLSTNIYQNQRREDVWHAYVNMCWD